MSGLWVKKPEPSWKTSELERETGTSTFLLHYLPVCANKAVSTTNSHGGHLQPLCDIRTGEVIPAYPRTLTDISNLNAFEAERILRALQQELGLLRCQIRGKGSGT